MGLALVLCGGGVEMVPRLLGTATGGTEVRAPPCLSPPSNLGGWSVGTLQVTR